VIDCLGNRFSERGLPTLGEALTANSGSNLYLLKLGDLRCSREEFFDEFIANFVSFAPSLRLLAIVTPHALSKAIRQVNQSNSFVYVIADVESRNGLESTWTLEQYNYVITALKDVQLKRERHGDQLLQSCFARPDLSYGDIEQLVVIFQTLISPETPMMNGLSAFHNFVEQGKTKEVLICIKQGIEVGLKTPSSARFPESNALHIASINDHDVII